MHDGGLIRFPFETPPEPGAANEVAPGVLWMRIPLPMVLDHVNVYALDEGSGWTIVDTGLNHRMCRAAWDALRAGPLAGKPITRVILTHHHPDHVGLVGMFEGAELLTSRTAYLMARMLMLDPQDRPSPETIAFWQGAGMAPELLEKRRNERPFNFADVTIPLPLGFTRLAEGGTLRAGGRLWDVRLGQGHAPDHVTLWARDEPLVLGGDQFLPSISPNLGVYATEPLADPVGDWLASCWAFKAFAAPDILVLPGHKRPFTGLPDRLDNKIANHVEALDRLRAHLVEPRSAAQCFAPVFGRDITPDDSAYGLALGEAVGHLNHLLALGEVSRNTRADGVWEWRRT